MPISDYCQSDVETVDVAASLREAARQFARSGVGALIAVEGRLPRGVLTDRDVAMHVLREGLDPDDTPVGAVIAPDPIVVHGSSPLRVATTMMRQRAVRRLPVVDESENLVGVIALDDLVRVVAGEIAGIAATIAAQAPTHDAAGSARSDSGPEVE